MGAPRNLLLLAALLGGLLQTGLAAARTEAESRYTKAQTYSAALRFLRVDLGYEITERDPDAAYLLFRYLVPGRREPAPGSIEIIETRDRVKCLIQIPQLPSYHEVVLRDGLLSKLRNEYGDPPEQARPGDGKRPNGKRPDDKQPDKGAPPGGEKPPSNSRPSDDDTPAPNPRPKREADSDSEGSPGSPRNGKTR